MYLIKQLLLVFRQLMSAFFEEELLGPKLSILFILMKFRKHIKKILDINN